MAWVGPTDVSPKSRIQGQAADIRIDPRKREKGGRGVRPGREGNKYRYRLSCGQLGLGPEGELWEMMWGMPQSCRSQGA